MATVATFSVGSLATSAIEITKAFSKSVAEKEFITSFDDDCETVAEYLINSGISLDETKK